MSNKLYDILSKIQRWLPAAAVAYMGLASIWGWPLGAEISDTVAVVVTLLAATLEISTAIYERGQKNLAGKEQK